MKIEPTFVDPRLGAAAATEQRAREEAIADLLAGLEVGSIAELRILVEVGRVWQRTADRLAAWARDALSPAENPG